MAVADMEYRVEKKGKKQAYKRLKQIARLQGKKPPPNRILVLLRKYKQRRGNTYVIVSSIPGFGKIVNKMKEEKATAMQEGWRGGDF